MSVEASKNFDPQDRLKHLLNYINSVEVDFNVPPLRYYRSGLEMVRMANVYYQEGNLECAYVLYLKFMTIFLEKIRRHPDFNTVPAKTKADNLAKLREILPKSEKIKEELLNHYKAEYEKYLEEEKRKSEAADSVPKQSSDTPKRIQKGDGVITVQQPSNFDTITYPDPSVATVYPPTPQSDIKQPTPTPHPSIDRSKKPSQIFENLYESTKLKPVVVPNKVITQFQLMAQKNTVKNIETCGILAGKLERNELIITHVILPKQKGTADSCVTMKEEEIFDFQDQHNLITIGWIHTHPSQTAFLSSVDLHTHCPYQLLMPEAIAIVISPKFNETGFFVLTPEYGLKFISNCKKTGFHPHPTEPALFRVADHVKMSNDVEVDVVDLRNEK